MDEYLKQFLNYNWSRIKIDVGIDLKQAPLKNDQIKTKCKGSQR